MSLDAAWASWGPIQGNLPMACPHQALGCPIPLTVAVSTSKAHSTGTLITGPVATSHLGVGWAAAAGRAEEPAAAL